MAQAHPMPQDAHLLAQEAARAEAEGDFARARALSVSVKGHKLQSPSSKASSKSPPRQWAVAVEAASDRLRRLGTDPVAWQVGLGALVSYVCAWIYALNANR